MLRKEAQAENGFLIQKHAYRKVTKVQTSYLVIIPPGYFYISYDCVSS